MNNYPDFKTILQRQRNLSAYQVRVAERAVRNALARGGIEPHWTRRELWIRLTLRQAGKRKGTNEQARTT